MYFNTLSLSGEEYLVKQFPSQSLSWRYNKNRRVTLSNGPRLVPWRHLSAVQRLPQRARYVIHVCNRHFLTLVWVTYVPSNFAIFRVVVTTPVVFLCLGARMRTAAYGSLFVCLCVCVSVYYCYNCSTVEMQV